MSVDTIYTLVQDDVGRPDKQAVIWRRIHRSLLKLHRYNDWGSDLVEQEFNTEYPNTISANQQAIVTGSNALFMNTFGSPNATINIQQIPVNELIRFREIAYIRKWMSVDQYGQSINDPTTGYQGTYQGGDLIERSVDSPSDAYGFDIQDVYYRSGDVIQINSSTPISRAMIGYYADPKINLNCNTQETFEDVISWIADRYEALVACDVKIKIFGDIGKTDEMKTAMAEYQDEFGPFMVNNINMSTRKG